MQSKHKAVLVAAVLIAVAAIVAALFINNNKAAAPAPTSNTQPSNTNSATNNSAANAVATDTVTIQGLAFSPATITVKAGTKVTWTNKDSVAHTVTADNPSSDAPASDTLANGKSYSFTFTKAGTYAYHCQFHSHMTGTVIVTE